MISEEGRPLRYERRKTRRRIGKKARREERRIVEDAFRGHDGVSSGRKKRACMHAKKTKEKKERGEDAEEEKTVNSWRGRVGIWRTFFFFVKRTACVHACIL